MEFALSKLGGRFDQLSQDGRGLDATAFNPSTLYQVLFQIPVGANFGIWIDDIAFTLWRRVRASRIERDARKAVPERDVLPA